MIRNLIVFFLFTCVLFSSSLSAQNVKINEETVITEMMDRFATINKGKTNVEGYRIQLLATTDRKKLESVKQGFQYRYPNIAVDWIQTPPYYKLRAGAFATKLEALRLLHILKRDYSNAYLAIDKNIRPFELIGSIY